MPGSRFDRGDGCRAAATSRLNEKRRPVGFRRDQYVQVSVTRGWFLDAVEALSAPLAETKFAPPRRGLEHFERLFGGRSPRIGRRRLPSTTIASTPSPLSGRGRRKGAALGFATRPHPMPVGLIAIRTRESEGMAKLSQCRRPDEIVFIPGSRRRSFPFRVTWNAATANILLRPGHDAYRSIIIRTSCLRTQLPFAGPRKAWHKMATVARKSPTKRAPKRV